VRRCHSHYLPRRFDFPLEKFILFYFIFPAGNAIGAAVLANGGAAAFPCTFTAALV